MENRGATVRVRNYSNFSNHRALSGGVLATPCYQVSYNMVRGQFMFGTILVSQQWIQSCSLDKHFVSIVIGQVRSGKVTSLKIATTKHAK